MSALSHLFPLTSHLTPHTSFLPPCLGKKFFLTRAQIFVVTQLWLKKAFVLSNAREITEKDKITYVPIYNVMFFGTKAK